MQDAPTTHLSQTEPDSALVTVVIPAFNAEAFIEYTMRSVARQTYRPMELIVVDDCSPDLTGEIAERLALELAEPGFSIRVEHHAENLGGAGALHTGFGLARGEYICWLSADDAFASAEKTANQVATMASGAGLTYDSASFYGPSPEGANRWEHHWCNRRMRPSESAYLRRPDWRLLALNIGNPINGSSVMIRRDVIERFGTFDPVLRNIDQDSDLWLRYSALGVRFAITDQTGVFYRFHAGQTSNLTDQVANGCALTRLRVLQALVDSGQLADVLNRAWPTLLLAHPAQYAQFVPVSQALCTFGIQSGCGVIPRMLLSGLRWALRRRGHWDEDRLNALLDEAAVSAQSEEFQRFTQLLAQKG